MHLGPFKNIIPVETAILEYIATLPDRDPKTRVLRLTPTTAMSYTEVNALPKNGRLEFQTSGISYDINELEFATLGINCIPTTAYISYIKAVDLVITGCNVSATSYEQYGLMTRLGGRYDLEASSFLPNVLTYWGDLGVIEGETVLYYAPVA